MAKRPERRAALNKAGPFTVARATFVTIVYRDGEHFATLNDHDTAKRFAAILNELLQMAQFAGAWDDAADPGRAAWRVGALVAKAFKINFDMLRGEA